MRSAPVAPVITGNIPTRKRSTSPARSRDRHRLRLPIVLRSPEPFSFMARTVSTASSRTSVELVHASGSSSEEENTTLDACVSSSTDASSSALNSSWPRDLAGGEAGHQAVGVRSHQVGDLGLLAEPSEVLRALEAPEPGPALSRCVAVEGGDEVDEKL